jgi:DNA repair protein RadC
LLNARARFLQGRFCLGNRRARRCKRAARHARALGCLQPLLGLIERRGHLAEPALRRAALHGLLGGGFLRGSLCAIAAVECVVQRQPIVALRDGILRVLQRFDRRVVLFGGVAIGACGPRGVAQAMKREREKSSAATETNEERRNICLSITLAMKALSIQDRPREKLFRLGAAGLGDNELVAIVVGSGSRRVNALALANDILKTTGGLHGMPRTSVDELRRLDGMGTAKAAQVLAAVELGRRTLLRCPPARLQFVTPRDAAAYLLPQFGARPVEQFGLMMLDTKHRLIRTSVVSVGTLDSSPAHPREIFREAASACAAAIVLFHNHPSGDPQPSRDDIELTRRLVQAGEIMGIDVIDHVILADTRYFSFREAGKL